MLAGRAKIQSPVASAVSAAVPRAYLLTNVVLLLLTLGLARFNASRLFDLRLPDLASPAVLLPAGAATLLPALLPASTRRRLLVLVRRLLGSRRAVWLTATAFVTCLLASFISTCDLRWVGPEKITVRVGDSDREIASRLGVEQSRVGRIYGLAGTRLNLSIAEFKADVRLPFIRGAVLNLPFYATSASARLAAEEQLLVGTFFNLFDRKGLTDLKERFAAIRPLSESDKLGVVRLQRIRDILDNSANGTSSAETKMVLVDNFADAYPGDPWTPLLKAQAEYGSRQFEKCAERISPVTPVSRSQPVETLNGTRLFLRGMCQMKGVVVAPDDPASQGRRLAAANALIEAGTRRLAASGADRRLVANAQASGYIYRAIGAFYSGDMQGAHTAFKAAADLSPAGERARALNNAGFAAFVQADLADARQDYMRAYEDQPSWPYIKANVAYLDVAEGRMDSAQRTFREIARDPAYAVSSPQDVRLAEIMLLEISHENGAPLEQINRGYHGVVRKVQGATWEFEPDPSLRYGLLIHEVVNRIYLGGDYFGLEMFALTATCKARAIVHKSKVNEKERSAVLSRLQADARALRGRVKDRWLSAPRSGWFAHLARCFSDSAPR